MGRLCLLLGVVLSAADWGYFSMGHVWIDNANLFYYVLCDCGIELVVFRFNGVIKIVLS